MVRARADDREGQRLAKGVKLVFDGAEFSASVHPIIGNRRKKEAAR